MEGRHRELTKVTTNPAKLKADQGSQDRCTQAPQCRGWAREAETREQKPHKEEGVPGEWKQVRTSPLTQRVGLGHREKCAQALRYTG